LALFDKLPKWEDALSGLDPACGSLPGYGSLAPREVGNNAIGGIAIEAGKIPTPARSLFGSTVVERCAAPAWAGGLGARFSRTYGEHLIQLTAYFDPPQRHQLEILCGRSQISSILSRFHAIYGTQFTA